jgi:hypothetical protein
VPTGVLRGDRYLPVRSQELGQRRHLTLGTKKIGDVA